MLASEYPRNVIGPYARAADHLGQAWIACHSHAVAAVLQSFVQRDALPAA